MNLSSYTTYFHDGSLIDLFHNDSTIVFSLESAEISPEENLDNIPLSDHSTIKGKLHLEEVDFITENEQPFSGIMQMLYDSASILHLKIQDTKVDLDLEWVNFPPNPQITAYSFYCIQAKKIWWENIPDLHDPFW